MIKEQNLRDINCLSEVLFDVNFLDIVNIGQYQI